jgi:hypothetical protein
MKLNYFNKYKVYLQSTMFELFVFDVNSQERKNNYVNLKN